MSKNLDRIPDWSLGRGKSQSAAALTQKTATRCQIALKFKPTAFQRCSAQGTHRSFPSCCCNSCRMKAGPAPPGLPRRSSAPSFAFRASQALPPRRPFRQDGGPRGCAGCPWRRLRRCAGGRCPSSAKCCGGRSGSWPTGEGSRGAGAEQRAGLPFGFARALAGGRGRSARSRSAPEGPARARDPRAAALGMRAELRLYMSVRAQAWTPVREERLRELGLFCLEKRRLWDNLIVAFQNLRGASRNRGAKQFAGVCRDGQGGNGFKVKESSLC